MKSRRTNRSRRRATEGFSLAEVILVLVLISTLSAIAIPRYGQSVAHYRADMAAKRVVADLAYARQHAISTSAQVIVTFDTASHTCAVSGAAGLRRNGSTHTTNFSAAPYEASVRTADFGGDGEIRFDGYGQPDTGGTVEVQVGDFVKTIVLEQTSGHAAVQ